ncbi:hypothetical protein DPMN_123166 [Dreissena polymorpha]|uniref:Growth factor receptor domain-containing protein n=1 Tax=Dreissena polymorpha TaxID=45954 RepID=A0A9D4GWW9_DREPO|nr:hypothetical protein DPMN_123166 [Dreissena polymorpha]
MELKHDMCAIYLTMTFVFEYVTSKPTFWCPVGRFPLPDGHCEICYENCGELGCTGPGSHLGPGGCTSCWLGLKHHHDNVECMSPFSACPDGYYRKTYTHGDQITTVCKPCHPLCKTCTGAGISNCIDCRFFRWDGQCVQACPIGSVIRHGNARTCVITGSTHSGRSRNSFYLLPYRDRHHQAP